MSWKNSFRSIYYEGAPEPADLDLGWKETALLVIYVQNTYLARPDRATLTPDEQRRYDAWTPFHSRMRDTVIPRTADLLVVGSRGLQGARALGSVSERAAFRADSSVLVVRPRSAGGRS